MKFSNRNVLCVLALLFYLDTACAVEFMKKGAAIKSQLKTAQAFQNTVLVGKEKVEFFYAKGKNQKAARLAVIQSAIYDPNCTHTWVIGLDSKTCKVDGIEVVEMSCPHAFPCQKKSFIDQYIGKGPVDVDQLDSKVVTVAKATGSSVLTTQAVQKSIKACEKVKGKI